mmetsp:Transcript_34580/g.78346  ORF Transcript_34580/g.78346 Transcript_34580/m.78346 type:complete len:85 (-) Transcript_34580:598-852(-)
MCFEGSYRCQPDIIPLLKCGGTGCCLGCVAVFPCAEEVPMKIVLLGLTLDPKDCGCCNTTMDVEAAVNNTKPAGAAVSATEMER